MARAFLYLVVESCRSPVQSLYMVHRINPSRLFFSDKDDQRLRAAEAAEIKARLPRPAVSLYPSFNFPVMDLVLFGRNKDKLVAMDYRGRTVLYDDALRAVSALPSMKEFEYYHWRRPLSVSLPVGDDLFVMNNVPSCYSSGTSVGALINHGHGSAEPHMFWHSIRPPPYVKPEYDPDASHCDDSAEAYTVVGDSQVWVSAESYGTYSLDMKNFRYGQEESDETRRGEWSKVGDWVLPFSGPAVYAPELNLWFRFSKEKDDTYTSSNRVICAADLQQAGAAKPPMVSHQRDFTVPMDHKKYCLDGSSLVHLGGWEPVADSVLPASQVV